jgi:CheY-like chemotaxis protein
MTKPLRILLIEDSERDAALMLLYLRRAGYEPTIQRVEDAGAMQTQLDSAQWDVIISDFNLPAFNAYQALEMVRESGRRIPFILVSGEMSEAIVSAITKAGAAGCVAKYELKKIVPAIERAMQVR